ncbi:hypothetical protein CDV31_005180 [Fusarium ambrosium]|uniref:Methyltransferase n=1 Tax=Fusarium ambrosium TaxID=131363 RepID=A0A428ULB2_9HYPO|nr:hypothetical protein CDV31_005180 [Fusarium ambrosium]
MTLTAELKYLKWQDLHRTSFENFKDREAVESLYLPEVEEILRSNLDGVDGCFVFNWRLRNTEPELPGEIDLNDPTDFRRPATHLHVDQSPASVLNRIKLQFPEKADQLLQGRVRVVKYEHHSTPMCQANPLSRSVWRPLVNEISDWPLALCDGRTVDPGDLVETDHIQRKYTGPTMYMMHNPKHKFYFYGGQGKEDVLIFKNFDSLDGVCPYAPHAAFRDPVLRPRGEPRESIEVRCLVFTDPKALGAGC